MSNTLKRLSSAGVLLLAVGCADIPNAPDVTKEAATAVEVTETVKPIQAVDENLLALDTSNVTVLKESDLMKAGTYQLANIGSKRREKPLPANINQLNPENAINSSAPDAVITRKANALAKTSALANPGFYQTVVGYLTGTGQYATISPIPVASGEVLCIQVDLPNSSQIDYDAYLFELDVLGNAVLVDASQYATYINSPYGTVPEAVGAYNNSNATKNYLLLVNSYKNGSPTLPFTVHIGIRANNSPLDSQESDEHADKATFFSLESPNPSINFRSANTLCDNDWFKFITPVSKVFNSILFTLDAASVNAGYKLEVYRVVSGTLRRMTPSVDNRISVETNTIYYVRITSTGANDLTGANYTITLYPDYPVDSIQITSRGGGEMATYCQGSFPTFTRYRVQGGQQITINGIVRYAAQNKAVVVPNADVKFTFRNPYYNSAHNGELSTTVKSNSSGAFTATLPVGPAAGENSCTFGNVIWFRHTFDIRDFDIKSGLVNGNWRVTTPPEAVFLLATDERI